MDFDQIRYETDGPVATITLNRPDKLNAYTRRMMHEIVTAMDIADADDAVRAVIFTGAGERAFCAGADLTPDTGGGSFSSDEEVAELSDERMRDGGASCQRLPPAGSCRVWWGRRRRWNGA